DHRAQATGCLRRLRGAHELCDAPGMIAMCVRIENPLDVAQIDPETANVGFDQRCVTRHASVDQNMARGCCYEKDAEATRPDIPGVSIDAKRRLGGSPRGSIDSRGIIRSGCRYMLFEQTV